MDQKAIGAFIAQKRKEHHFTQEELAQHLGITNKSISKWENGHCMPDLSIQQELCKCLKISISELLAGKEMNREHPSAYDKNVIELMKMNQKMKFQKNIFIGMFLIVLGRLPVPSYEGASSLYDFLHGFGTGVSIMITLLGVFIVIYTIAAERS